MCSYLHIMLHNSEMHNGLIINMLQERNDLFDFSKHTFLIKHNNVANNHSAYDNVIYEPNIDKDISIIDSYNKKYDIIFIHNNLFTAKYLIRLSKKIMNKMIWVVWGNDLYLDDDINLTFKDRLSIMIKRHYANSFFGIGVGFRYDAIQIRKRYNARIKIFDLPYLPQLSVTEIELINNSKCFNEKCRIMIGHSAYPFLNHIEVLKRLKIYRDKDIIISLVLSYGDQEYAKRVICFAKELFGNKVEIIDKSISYDKYLTYLQSVDIAIFDYVRQSALGNYYLLSLFGKKMYVNNNGILKLSSRLEGFQTFDANTIGEMSFEEFVNPIDANSKTNMRRFAEYFLNKNTCAMNWKYTIDEIKSSINT